MHSPSQLKWHAAAADCSPSSVSCTVPSPSALLCTGCWVWTAYFPALIMQVALAIQLTVIKSQDVQLDLSNWDSAVQPPCKAETAHAYLMGSQFLPDAGMGLCCWFG